MRTETNENGLTRYGFDAFGKAPHVIPNPDLTSLADRIGASPASPLQARLIVEKEIESIAQGPEPQTGMPCEYLIDSERRLVISRGTGTFRYADFLEHLERMRGDPRFQPGFDHLVDCTQFENIDLTTAQIQELGRRSLFAASSRRALVVASLLHYGLARMFAAFRHGYHRQQTTVFRELADATNWLGLPPDWDLGGSAKSPRTTKEA